MKIPAMVLPSRRLAGGVAIGILVGILGVGAVTAAAPGPSSAAGTAVTAPAAASPAPGIGAAPAAGATVTGQARGPLGRIAALRRLIGRNFRVDVAATSDQGTRNLTYVRGSLHAGTGSITVTLPDASTQAYTVDASTIVRESGHAITLGDLPDGSTVMVFGVRNADGTATARLIRGVMDSAPAAGGAAPGVNTP
jgi:hypothetical protein